MQERAWAQERAQFSWAPRQERAQAQNRPTFDGRLGRSGLRRIGRSGLSRGIHAELPHPAQALVEPVRAGRCAFHRRSSARSPFTFSKVVPLGSASAALTAASRRSCAVKAPAGADIVGARGSEATTAQRVAAGGNRNCTHAKSTLVSTLVVAKC